jgi:hypothetical protein
VAENQFHDLFEQALNSAVRESFGKIQLPSFTDIKASWEVVSLQLEKELEQPFIN